MRADTTTDSQFDELLVQLSRAAHGLYRRQRRLSNLRYPELHVPLGITRRGLPHGLEKLIDSAAFAKSAIEVTRGLQSLRLAMFALRLTRLAPNANRDRVTETVLRALDPPQGLTEATVRLGALVVTTGPKPALLLKSGPSTRIAMFDLHPYNMNPVIEAAICQPASPEMLRVIRAKLNLPFRLLSQPRPQLAHMQVTELYPGAPILWFAPLVRATANPEWPVNHGFEWTPLTTASEILPNYWGGDVAFTRAAVDAVSMPASRNSALAL